MTTREEDLLRRLRERVRRPSPPRGFSYPQQPSERERRLLRVLQERVESGDVVDLPEPRYTLARGEPIPRPLPPLEEPERGDVAAEARPESLAPVAGPVTPPPGARFRAALGALTDSARRSPVPERTPALAGSRAAPVVLDPVGAAPPSVRRRPRVYEWERKDGVVIDRVAPEIEAASDLIERAHVEVAGRPPIITSGREGQHMPGSLHPQRRALDFRTRDLDEDTKRKLHARLAAELGPDWDVIIEPTHIHAEFQPERRRRAPEVSTLQPSVPVTRAATQPTPAEEEQERLFDVRAVQRQLMEQARRRVEPMTAGRGPRFVPIADVPPEERNVVEELAAGIARGDIQNWQALADAIETIGMATGSERLRRAGQAISEAKGEVPENLRPRIEGSENIRSFRDLIDWLAFGTGQALSSTAAPLAGGIAGAAVAGPVGALAGAAGPSYALNFSALKRELEAEGVDEERATAIAAAGAVPMAALDVIVPARLGTRMSEGIRREAARGLARRIATDFLREGVAEAGTEVAQEAIGSGVVSAATPREFFTEENLRRILEVAPAAFLTGGGMSAATTSVAGLDPAPRRRAEALEGLERIERESQREEVLARLGRPRRERRRRGRFRDALGISTERSMAPVTAQEAARLDDEKFTVWAQARLGDALGTLEVMRAVQLRGEDPLSVPDQMDRMAEMLDREGRNEEAIELQEIAQEARTLWRDLPRSAEEEGRPPRPLREILPTPRGRARAPSRPTPPQPVVSAGVAPVDGAPPEEGEGAPAAPEMSVDERIQAPAPEEAAPEAEGTAEYTPPPRYRETLEYQQLVEQANDEALRRFPSPGNRGRRAMANAELRDQFEKGFERAVAGLPPLPPVVEPGSKLDIRGAYQAGYEWGVENRSTLQGATLPEREQPSFEEMRRRLAELGDRQFGELEDRARSLRPGDRIHFEDGSSLEILSAWDDDAVRAKWSDVANPEWMGLDDVVYQLSTAGARIERFVDPAQTALFGEPAEEPGAAAATPEAPEPTESPAAAPTFTAENPMELGQGRRAYKEGDTWHVWSTREGRYVAFPNDPQHPGYRVWQAMEREAARRTAPEPAGEGAQQAGASPWLEHAKAAASGRWPEGTPGHDAFVTGYINQRLGLPIGAPPGSSRLVQNASREGWRMAQQQWGEPSPAPAEDQPQPPQQAKPKTAPRKRKPTKNEERVGEWILPKDRQASVNDPGALAAYFRPGAIVTSSYWGTQDRVIAFTPTGGMGGGWSVTVQEVRDRHGNEVTDAAPRTHSTTPTRAEFEAEMRRRGEWPGEPGAVPPAAPGAAGAAPAPAEAPTAPAPPASDARSRIEERAQRARDRLRRKYGSGGPQLQTFGVDPEDIADLAIIGAEHVVRGARATAEWTRAMVREFGEAIRPLLERIRALTDRLLAGERPRDIPELAGLRAEHLAELEGQFTDLRAQLGVIEEYDEFLDDLALEEPGDQRGSEEAAEEDADGQARPEVRGEDQAGVPGVPPGSERDAQPDSPPGDSSGVASGQPGVRGPSRAGRPAGPGGVRGAGTDVEGDGSADEGGVPGDRRPGTGRTDVSDAGSGPSGADRGGDRAQEGDGEGVEPSPANHSTGNYHLKDPAAILGGGKKTKFRRNRDAIEKYLQLRDEGRPPTPEEQDILAAYTGWGAFGQELFQGSWKYPRPKEGWEAEDAWLREHLGQAEWEAMQRSITNAHYTDPPTVIAMWDMVRRMGFTGGRVLEPGMGVGNFFAMMPRDLMSRSELTGIELDRVTGGIAQMLYPRANIRIMGYEESKTPDGFYDLIIGNWPFEETRVPDRRYNRLNPSLHDYYWLKTLDQVRPGGIVIGITSPFTMDKKGTKIRRELAKKAELIAAFRLPSGTFEKYAGTKVVGDILVFRKRPEPVATVEDETWINVVEYRTPSGETIAVNQYFVDHPEAVLGTLDYGHGTTTGRPGMIVRPPADIEEAVRRMVKAVPQGAYLTDTRGESISYITNHTDDRQGSLTRTDDGFFVVHGEHLAPADQVLRYKVKDKATTAEREAQFEKLINLRRLYGELLEAERGVREGDPEKFRARLREAYEAFVRAHGPLRDSFGLGYLKRIRDPFYSALAALETGSEGNWRPSTVLFRSTMRAPMRIENPSIEDAFVLARNKSVNPTLDEIASIADRPAEEVKKRLIEVGAIFETPSGDIAPADIYLSGNVREKLRQAEAALAEGNTAMERNVAALKEVLPPDVPYFNIEAQFGATWVPARVYEEFVAHMLNLPSTEGIKVRYVAGAWRVDLDRRHLSRTEAQTGFGTSEYRFNRLVDAAFVNQTVTVRRKDSRGDVYVDEEATEEVNARIAQIREAFSDWLWLDAERRIVVEREYNEVMNAHAEPRFDGSFLRFEGMALSLGDGPFDLRRHQANAIWRALVTRKSIMAHEVGTGKTFTIAGIAVESRRYGIARKPLVLAHNANSKAVAAGIQAMYPAAKVLYVDNLAPSEIDIRLRQIANDDWDAIVLPHSLIDRLSFKEETLMAMAREEIEALEEEAELAAQEDGVHFDPAVFYDPKKLSGLRSATAKKLVKARNNLISQIKKQAQRSSREGAIAFEDLGIDMLLVDEAHEFKKPPIATRKKWRGLQTETSNRSIALSFMARYVREHNNGGNVHLFTGTPITNTLTEVFHLMRYIMHEELVAMGISHWDAWSESFARASMDVELTPAGEYEPVTRLRDFVNVAELRRIIGQYMDVVFADEMPEMQPRRTRSGKTLDDPSLTEEERAELLNGRTEGATDRPYRKVIVDNADMTDEQLAVFRHVQRLAAQWREMKGKDRRDAMAIGSPVVPIIHEQMAADASFDARLVRDEELAGQEGKVPDNPNSKISRAIRNILEVYQSDPRTTQVVFTNTGLGTTAERIVRDANGFPVRDKTGQTVRRKVRVFSPIRDMIERLVQAGIPREEIALIDGSTSKDKRQEIADAMNEGKIRIVIGSTGALGVGVNMQRNLRAMHHLDAPWMPGDQHQRNGRGHRQGNQWNTVLEYRYITDRLDGRRWQVLAIKDRFINRFLRADYSVRVIEGDAASSEESDILSTFAEAAGDPRVLLVQKMRAKVEQLQKRERLYSQGVAEARDKARQERREREGLEARLRKIDEAGAVAAAEQIVQENAGQGFRMEVDGKTYEKRDEANEALKAWVARNVSIGDRGKPLGQFGGHTVTASWSKWAEQPRLEIDLNGITIASQRPSVGSLEFALRQYPDNVEGIRERVAQLESSIARLEEVAEQPFPRAQDLELAKRQLEALEADLAANPVPPPAWLRLGAPVDTDVFWHGTKLTVTGHRWTKTGWFVVAQRPDGSEVVIPYLEARDEQGMPLYEERPFESPLVEKPTAATGEGVEVAPGEEAEPEARAPPAPNADPNDIWDRIAQPSRGHADLFSKYVWHVNAAETVPQLDLLEARLQTEAGEITAEQKEKVARRITERRKEIRARESGEGGFLDLAGIIDTIRGRRADPDTDGLVSQFPDVEERIKAAKGVKSERARERALGGARRLVQLFRRQYELLDPNADAKTAVTVDILRQLEAAPAWAQAVAVARISEIVEGLSEQQVDLMSRILFLDDIMRDIEEGKYGEPDDEGRTPKPLPFGYESVQDLRSDQERFRRAAMADEKVRAAIAKRQAFAQRLTRKLVKYGLLPEAVLKDPRYYHRQVMKHFNARQYLFPGTSTRDVRTQRKGFQRRRVGGGDFNTRYQEAEFEWVAQALTLLARKDAQARLRQINDIRDSLKHQARILNERAVVKMFADRAGVEPDMLKGKNHPLFPFRSRIAMARDKLIEMAENGELEAASGRFDHVIEALDAGVTDIPEWFDFLAHLIEHDLPGANWAATIFKAIREREQFVKDTLGDRYTTWEDLIPEGYTTWQPDPGKILFRAHTIEERVLERVLAGEKILEREDVKDMLVVGRDKETWVIPEEMAATFSELKPDITDDAVEGLVQGGQATWKQWTLLNPYRVIRYNLNNLSGDLDIALAYNPRILGYMKQAARDLWRHSRGKAIPRELRKEIEEGIRRGVLNSGLTIAEIPDVNQAGALKALYSDDPNVVMRLVEKWWGGSKNFTNWRENVLRLAAWRFFREELAKGKRLYGASSRTQIDALTDNEQRAAKLARELIGDYGAVSTAGRWLRRRMIPFYSWMEINAPRYVRLLKNLPHEEGGFGRLGRVGAAGAARTGAKLGVLALKANILFGLVYLWNAIFFGDEDDELRRRGDQGIHLILGRTEDGEIRSIRIEGALIDALRWADLHNWPQDFRELFIEGSKDWLDQASEAVKAPIDRIVTSLAPVRKTAFEVALGRSAYPTIFQEGKDWRPRFRPIRDRGEHVARTLSVDWLYRQVTNKPRRGGVLDGLTSLLITRTDPGEAAYFEIRQKTVDWLREQGRETPSIQPTAKSNALYYWKKATEWGDEERAQYWLNRYYELGGTRQSLSASVTRSAPLGAIAQADRRRFIATLNEREREALRLAEEWYKTYERHRGPRSRQRRRRPRRGRTTGGER